MPGTQAKSRGGALPSGRGLEVSQALKPENQRTITMTTTTMTMTTTTMTITMLAGWLALALALALALPSFLVCS